MDIIKLCKEQVDKWNLEEKGGLCWEFSAPLVRSQINIVQSDTCCVNFFVTDVSFSIQETRSKSGYINSKTKIWSFNINAMVQGNLGVNNYNEIKGHEVDESNWVNTFLPIAECFEDGNIFDFCEFNFKQVGDARLIHNYLDSNWNGWQLKYSFSETIKR